MIRVIIPGGFIPERVYAIHVLLYEFLGLIYTIEVRIDEKAYVFEHEGKQIRIADHFFSHYTPEGSYLKPEAIPQTSHPARRSGLDGIECIYGEDHFLQDDKRIECGVDLIAGTFFMLTRWEEYVDPTRDQHGRFPAQASLAMRAGFLNRPVINEYVALLRKWFRWMGVPEDAFRVRTFQLSLHCDVDSALYWPSKLSVIRKIAFQLFRQKSMSGVFNEIGLFIRYLKGAPDPYDTYTKLMDLAERNGTKATFCFLVGEEHPLDGRQSLKRTHVRRIYDQIREKGHLPGIHFSYRTADDEKVMQAESSEYEKMTDQAPQFSRQHFLRCSVPATWRAWELSGIAHDFTLGYPEAAGFRCGVCFPFPLFDVEDRRMLHVMEHPLITMDMTFKRYKNTSPEQTIGEVKDMMEVVKKYNGEFVFLWHNSSFAIEWEGWERVPDDVLK